ncbi:cytochrome P450 [Nonomuraea sp. SYSU D8015]|uniref:cytochrome P450 n=1 Tax=Nonomuraea sp. SYSU D8015 TaxID=2593644 RepID=UPI0021D33B7D|nr:cytochrome P450 [Nonomuraea sp. SYSU D8015]
MLIAGHETTANRFGLGTLLLLRHPDQFALVRDDLDPAHRWVEETLRYLSTVHTGPLRRATADLTINGTAISKGEQIAVSLPAANRDPHLLGEPDRFDVTRRPRAHTAFGHGIHQCLGQQLARMEL